MKGVLLHSPWLTVAAGDRSYIRIYLVWILKRKIINSSCSCVIRLRNYFHKFKRVGWSSPFFLPLLIWVFFLNLVEAKDKEKIQILNPDFFLLINYLVNLRLNKLRVKIDDLANFDAGSVMRVLYRGLSLPCRHGEWFSYQNPPPPPQSTDNLFISGLV